MKTTSFKTIRDYHLLDADRLTDQLIRTDWDSILNQDIDQATIDFTDAILNAADNAIPTRTIRAKHNDKPWYTNELRREARKRDRYFRTALRQQTEEKLETLENTRETKRQSLTNISKTSIEQTRCKNFYLLKNDPHKYHQIFKTNDKENQNSNITSAHQTRRRDYYWRPRQGYLLNDHFANQSRLNTGNRRAPDIQLPSNVVPKIRQKLFITEREVLKLLNSLDIHKSCGPDNLPPKILRLTAILIVSPLTKLFNKSLSLGKFPSTWKETKVHAIFKIKGSASDPSNYRPISLLPCISKIFEKITFNHVYSHISENNLFTDKQSGYRPNHSTQLQLHNLYKSLDIGNDFTAIFLDISKYFDKIWHVGLLHKCKILFGITGSLHNWLESYLTDRSIKVCVENSTSRPLLINAGCPQGSVLGPLLALIYLNDLAGKTHNDSLFYADDTSLYTSYSRQSSCTSPPQQAMHQQDFNTACNSLQNDLDIISEFGTNWHINFSADKTKQMTFTHATTSHSPVMSFIKRPVPSTKSHTHLGLTLSTDLRFHDHINNVIKKVNIALSPLYPIAKFLPRDILLQLYNTYILPIFDLEISFMTDW